MCQIRDVSNTFMANEIIRDYIKPIVVATGISAITAGCAAGVFGVINPVGGVIFGATAVAANAIASTILLTWSGDDPARLNLSGFLLVPLYFANMVAATALTIAAGFPMTWIAVSVCAGAVFASYGIMGAASM